MAPVEIREKLHEYIDNADEKKLEAIYTVLADSIAEDHKYTNKEIEVLYARRSSYKDQQEPILTTEEFVNYVISNKL